MGATYHTTHITCVCTRKICYSTCQCGAHSGSPHIRQRGSLAYLLRQKYWQMASLSLLSITNTPFKVLRQVSSIPGHFLTSPFASSSPSGRLQYCHSALPGSAFGAAGINTPEMWGSSSGVLGPVASFPLSCLSGICSFCSWDGDPTEEGRRCRRRPGGNVSCLGT